MWRRLPERKSSKYEIYVIVRNQGLFKSSTFLRAALTHADPKSPKMTDGLTLGVDFTKFLQAAFIREDHKSAKKADDLTVFFAFLGSAHVKAARKMLVKLTLENIW